MPIRVLIVDDSPFICRVLASFLRVPDEIEVIGHALSGERAIEQVAALRPDVVTLDLEMPGLGGLGALTRIMTESPTPVILFSGLNRKAAETTVAALDAGAVDFVPKYTPGQDTDPTALKHLLLTKVRLAAGVKVIRSLRSSPRPQASPPRTTDLARTPPPGSPGHGVLVVGASTGGPIALRELLGELPAEYPLPVLVVQHMPPNFTKALAEQLARQTQLRVVEASGGEKLRPGTVYVAPGDRHACIGSDNRLELRDSPKVNGHRPSVDVAMESAAAVYGRRAVGVLLTGMGEDGARGLLAVRTIGGTTFAQSAESCVVFGMPARAIELGAADHTDAPDAIARKLVELTGVAKGELSC